MRILRFIFVLGFLIAPAVFAGQVIYTHLLSPQPLAVSCADYLRTRPPDVWLDLSDCTVDYTQVVRVSKWGAGKRNGDVNYAALVGKIGEKPVKLFLKLPADESMMLNDVSDNPTAEELDELVAKLHPLAYHRHVRGLIQIGVNSNEDLRRGIAGAGIAVTIDWAILVEEEPTPLWLGLATLPIPIVSGGWLLWYLRRNRTQVPAAPSNPPAA